MSIIGNGVMPGGTEDDWMMEQYLTGTIKEAYSDEVERIRDYAFYMHTSLTAVSFPNITNIGNYAFYNCASLATVSFPAASYIGIGAFYYCSSLTTANFPNASYIEDGAFRDCSSLTAFYLPGTSVCTLANRLAFANTPISGVAATGYIYVPSSLVTAYQAADNWSDYASRISAIS